MYEQFKAISFLHRIVTFSRNGRVHIIGKDIEWCLDIVDGRLLFAAHSLQYLNALDTILPSLGCEAVLPVYWRLTQLDQYKQQIGASGLESLSWTSKIVGVLVQYNTLTLEQAETVLAKLSEDAIEALLRLEAATVSWYPIPTGLWYLETHGLYLTSRLNHFTKRLKIWQLLSDRISSPHQRPYCESLDSLYYPVPQGMLSRQMLEALARLMQGASIRQLAQAVNQDEIKLAQLLYPYIQHRAIKLWPPVPPFDRLPWLTPRNLSNSLASIDVSNINVPPPDHQMLANKPLSSDVTTNEQPSSVSVEREKAVNSLNSDSLVKQSSTTPKSRYLIICIDDSQAMLEKIEGYLDPKLFEVKAIIDPVSSISKICAMEPDLVLMDVSMPRINGNSLCRILKRSQIFKDVPIIMISSNTSPLNKATAQSAGATDYLEKPFSKVQLMTLLETHLEPYLAKSS